MLLWRNNLYRSSQHRFPDVLVGKRNMREQAQIPDVEQLPPEKPDFEHVASYEDGDDLVICDRMNPKAWIKSDTVTSAVR